MLAHLDVNKRLEPGEYERLLIENQLKLRSLAYQLYLNKRNLIIVFEGWDAAGKGGAIKRITERLDPRGYEVFPIAAPSGDDRSHHYLWRFWRRLKPPDEKQVQIFDRSWYGSWTVGRSLLSSGCTSPTRNSCVASTNARPIPIKPGS